MTRVYDSGVNGWGGAESADAGSLSLVVEPFLHIQVDRIYNPLTDHALAPHELAFDRVRDLCSGSLPVASLGDDERRQLALEAAALEASWRRAEQLAAIIDEEL